MFCKKCGKKLADGAKFCPYCGASAGGQAPAGQDVLQSALDTRTAPPAVPVPGPAVPPSGGGMPPKTGGKVPKAAVFAGAGAAAVLVIVLAVVVFSGLLGGPKAALGKAAAKSLNAYQAASGAVGMPDMKKLAESRQVRTDLSFQIKDFADELAGYSSQAEMLKGLGFTMSGGVDLPGRKMDLSAAVSYGSAGIITVWSQIDNDLLAVGCPELLDKDTYGLNTATLGKDLTKLSADVPEELEDVGFNVFDMIETFSKPIEVDKAAAKELADAIEAEKTGKASVEVNGHSVSCTGYRVVIPKDAMRAYINALEDAYKARELDKDVLDLLESMGVPKDELSGMRGEIRDAVNNKAFFDGLKEIVKTIGDLELEVYLSGGYVSSVVWEDKIEGQRLELNLQFGGGKNYADDLSAELDAGEVVLRWESSGNHGTEGGEYTDSSVFTVEAGGERYTVKSELEYHPKKASDNFEWTVKGEGFSFTAEGQLTTGKDTLFMDLERLSASAEGRELVRLSATYSVAPYSAPENAAKAPTMLSAMDEDDFEDLAADVMANGQSWLLGLADEVPELADYFW